MRSTWSRLFLCLLVAKGLSQTSGVPAQPTVDVPILTCWWSELRAALIRDFIYIDGGQRADTAANFDPWYNINTSLYIDLKKAFDITTSNLTELLTPYANASTFPNSSYSGYMFADDYQFVTYGGLATFATQAVEPLAANYIYDYAVFEENASELPPALGPTDATLPDDLTRYVTNGAGVSAPSEHLGYYFGGVTSDPATFDAGFPQEPSDGFIKVNMTNPDQLTWSTRRLPSKILTRVDAQLVWLPVSAQGILVTIGGVIYPEELFYDALNTSQVAESEKVSPSFMTTIPVYDIASETWYTQNTTGRSHPPQLTQFCSVLATDSGDATFNV